MIKIIGKRGDGVLLVDVGSRQAYAVDVRTKRIAKLGDVESPQAKGQEWLDVDRAYAIGQRHQVQKVLDGQTRLVPYEHLVIAESKQGPLETPEPLSPEKVAPKMVEQPDPGEVADPMFPPKPEEAVEEEAAPAMPAGPAPAGQAVTASLGWTRDASGKWILSAKGPSADPFDLARERNACGQFSDDDSMCKEPADKGGGGGGNPPLLNDDGDFDDNGATDDDYQAADRVLGALGVNNSLSLEEHDEIDAQSYAARRLGEAKRAGGKGKALNDKAWDVASDIYEAVGQDLTEVDPEESAEAVREVKRHIAGKKNLSIGWMQRDGQWVIGLGGERNACGQFGSDDENCPAPGEKAGGEKPAGEKGGLLSGLKSKLNAFSEWAGAPGSQSALAREAAVAAMPTKIKALAAPGPRSVMLKAHQRALSRR